MFCFCDSDVVQFLCVLRSDLSVQVRWLRNNRLVSERRYEQVSDELMHALHISDVTADDTGTFTAVASNCLGTASHSAKLNIDSLPSWSRRQYSPVNGVAELQRQEPLRHSPRSSEGEQTVTSLHLKMMPGSHLYSPHT